MNCTPKNIEILKANIERISSEDKRRLSSERRIEILGYLHLKKRQIDAWIRRLLFLDSLNENDSIASASTMSTPLWNLYNTCESLSSLYAYEIDSYTYWNRTNEGNTINLPSNKLSSRVESRYAAKSRNNNTYTYLEALSEIAEEEELNLSEIRTSLSKSLIQKIEANGIASRQLKGSRASLPI